MDDLNSHIEQARENAENIKKAIETLRTRIDILYNRIDYLEKDAVRTPQRLLEQVNEATKEQAKSVLAALAIEAVEETDEFNLALFKAPLLEAINNPDTYEFSSNREGYEFVVKIDLNKTAGSLRDYAAGVAYAREAYPMTQGAESASVFWAVFIYGAGREGKRFLRHYGGNSPRARTVDRTQKFVTMYKRTIARRIRGFAGKLAPWWEIVDKGTDDLELTSNRGGEAYPFYSGKHFVDRAKTEIINFYYDTLEDTLSFYRDEIYQRINYSRRELDNAITELHELLNQDLTKVEVAKIAIQKHLNAFYTEHRLESVNKELLDEIAENIVAGITVRRTIGRGISIRTVNIFKEYKRILEEFLK
jgi:hypothetical protein